MRPFILFFALVTAALADPRADLESATLAGAPADQQTAIRFLVKHMPARDVKSLTPEFLRENVALAYQARSEFPWAKEIPEEIFFNDVLPYASLDESRDAWRADFLKRFRPHTAGATTAREALIKVNAAVKAETGVDYNTKRRAANQGPSESMKLKMASCTGLSILLVDALRAVGLPARITGTAMWTTKEGNHNWVEVWLPDTRQWHFTEFYPDKAGLDHGWLIADAARGIPGSVAHGVFSTSWQKTDAHFPMVWAMRDESVPAVDVTQRYIDLGKKSLPEPGHCELRIEAIAKGQSGSAARRELDVQLMQGDVVVATGKTPSATADMNQFFTVKVKQGQLYQLFVIRDGKPVSRKSVEVGGKEETKKISLELPTGS
jgi:hypothetical protein